MQSLQTFHNWPRERHNDERKQSALSKVRSFKHSKTKAAFLYSIYHQRSTNAARHDTVTVSQRWPLMSNCWGSAPGDLRVLRTLIILLYVFGRTKQTWVVTQNSKFDYHMQENPLRQLTQQLRAYLQYSDLATYIVSLSRTPHIVIRIRIIRIQVTILNYQIYFIIPNLIDFFV